jgi:hypothetical protein
MCARNRNGGLENPLLRLNDWALDDYKTIMSEEVLTQIKGFFFCGNFGDPILNKDLLEMCRYSTEINPALNIRIHTNGSARTASWWKDLAGALPKTHLVVFALDGLSDTHSLYRVGTSFEKIIENAKAFIAAGGNAEWCFIRFKHNQDQVEEARQMSKDLGFSTFSMKNSSRFILEPKVDVLDKQGNTTHIIEPATDTPLKFIDKKAIDAYRQIVSESVIDCQALNQREVYIDAFKNVFPCCWIASTPYTYIDENDAAAVRYEMLSQYHNIVESFGGIDKLNATDNTVKDIIESEGYQTLWYKYWNERSLITCARMCGRAPTNDYAKSRDQLVNED